MIISANLQGRRMALEALQEAVAHKQEINSTLQKDSGHQEERCQVAVDHSEKSHIASVEDDFLHHSGKRKIKVSEVRPQTGSHQDHTSDTDRDIEIEFKRMECELEIHDEDVASDAKPPRPSSASASVWDTVSKIFCAVLAGSMVASAWQLSEQSRILLHHSQQMEAIYKTGPELAQPERLPVKPAVSAGKSSASSRAPNDRSIPRSLE